MTTPHWPFPVCNSVRPAYELISPTAFGVAIKRLREDRSLTQRQMATLSGISFRSVQDWEAGTKQRCLLATIPKLVSGLQLTPEEAASLTEAWRAAGPQLEDRPLRIKQVSGSPETAVGTTSYPEVNAVDQIVKLAHQLDMPEIACNVLDTCERIVEQAKSLMREVARRRRGCAVSDGL